MAVGHGFVQIMVLRVVQNRCNRFSCKTEMQIYSLLTETFPPNEYAALQEITIWTLQ